MQQGFPGNTPSFLDSAKAPLKPLDLPRRFADATLAGIEHPKVRAVAELYLKNFFTIAPKGIAPVFAGRAGVFKTYAAAFITKQLYTRAHIDGEFVQCASVLPALERQRFDKVTQQHIERLNTVPWLVMDDFAVIRPNTWAADFLLEIIERRYSERLPTCWTGNITFTKTDPSALEERYGVQFARRFLLGSEGYCLVVAPNKPTEGH